MCISVTVISTLVDVETAFNFRALKYFIEKQLPNINCNLCHLLFIAFNYYDCDLLNDFVLIKTVQKASNLLES